MKVSKIIRDPIHGNIRLSELEVELLDTPQMQRLRRIKQNGLCHLVYPAMHSTRFEHSLGVLHLASVMSDHLGFTKIDREPLRAAGLLHDVGHCPFSHTTDELLAKMGCTHEMISSQLIQDSEISRVLRKYGIKPSAVSDLVLGKTEYGKIISSEIDLDRMDYLVRDAYYAGVAYGVIDVERIISGLTLKDGEIVVEEGALAAVELLLISRNMMYETVYRHHTKRIAEQMLKHALDYAYSHGGLSFEEFRFMDDLDAICTLRNFQGYPSDIMKRIDERELFKTVARVRANLFTKTVLRRITRRRDKIEEEITEELKVKPGCVLLDYPDVKSSEFRIKVDLDGELKYIREVSYLARALEKSEKEKLTICVYASPDELEKFKKFELETYLG